MTSDSRASRVKEIAERHEMHAEDFSNSGHPEDFSVYDHAHNDRAEPLSIVAAVMEAAMAIDRYYDMNDLDEREEDNALEIPVRDLRALHSALKIPQPERATPRNPNISDKE